MNKDEQILSSIESSEIEAVRSIIMERASIWMICGFVQEANLLLELYWNLDATVDRNHFYDVGGLQIFWEMSNNYPSNVPYELLPINEIESENWSRHFEPHWKEGPFYQDSMKSKPFEEWHGKYLFLHSVELAYDVSSPTKEASKDLQVASLNGVKKYIETESPVGYDLMNALICASILAARNNLILDAQEFLKTWVENLPKYGVNTSIAWIMRDVSLAKILKDGFLAQTFNLTQNDCIQQLALIKKSLNNRFQGGPKLIFETLSWSELLRELANHAVKSEYFETTEEVDFLNLNMQPASSEAIQNCEARLGVTLPVDYKDFLKSSNGFPAYTSMTPTILPIADVDYLRNVYPDIIEDYIGIYQESSEGVARNFSNSLLIGGLEEEQQLLLVQNGHSANWECWLFANWIPGEHIYRSFRYYIESELFELEGESEKDE
ncbi:MAG: SMI1/KNR4 family protein [Bacteroidia bacterium]